MSSNGNQLSTLLQLLASQQGQQPAQQMSQQGQFNPADIQAGLQGGPQPFSFAPVQGGIGRNIINALANAGKAATYVAETPRERESDDARAQQLYETKQKMAMAAGEFGQREKDRNLQQQQLDVYRQAQLGEKKAGREATTQGKNEDRDVKLRGLGLDPDTGNPLPPDQMPPGMRSKIELNDAAENVKQAQAALANARAQNLPQQMKSAQIAHQVAMDNYRLKLAQFERDTFGQVPSAMTPGAASGPGAQSMATPPGTLTEGGQPQGWKSPSAPTAQTKTQAQGAKAVMDQAKDLIPQIDALSSKIGPVAGRWNNLWVNRAGSNDPDYAKLDQQLKLYASGLVKVHFGARGGGQQFIQKMMDDFHQAQSPENLKARIAGADQVLAGYANQIQANQPNQAPITQQQGQSQSSNGRRVIDLTQ